MPVVYDINFNKVEGYTPAAYEKICKLTKPQNAYNLTRTTAQIVATNPSLYNFTEDECGVLDSIIKIISLITRSLWTTDDDHKDIQTKNYSPCYIAVLAENGWGQYLDTFGKNEHLLHPNNVDSPSLLLIRPFLENITTFVCNSKNYKMYEKKSIVLRE